MKELSYQSIFNTLQEILPDDWHKVVFYAQYGESSYSMKYFVASGNGNYTECFKIKGISKRDIIKVFAAIDSKIMPIRKELSKKDTWYVMTLIVDNEGNFKADYEYDDVSDDLIEFYEMWKGKYLR